MRVTIKDVSREAGVSVATVSNVLNSPEVVAPETLERVTAVIAQLGYRPNRAAQALQGRRTFSIGYRMPDGTDGFALDVFLHRVVERAGESGLDIVLFTPKAGQSDVAAYKDMIRRGAVDGFVLSGTGHEDDRIAFLVEANFPFVTFGRSDMAGAHSWVDIDGRAGVLEATRHLLDLGHRRIALIGWPEGSITGDERFAGYRDGLEERGLDVDDEVVVRAENSVADGAAAMQRLLALPAAPTAVIAVQDLLALGAMNALRHAGLEPGRHIAVVGFDDIPSAAYTAPTLTSVRQPMERVGELVVEMLLDRLNQGTAARSAIVVPELVVRESSGGSVEVAG